MYIALEYTVSVRKIVFKSCLKLEQDTTFENFWIMVHLRSLQKLYL